MKNLRETPRAFTIVELLVVIAVLSLFAATLLPAFARTKAPVQRIYCVNNLKGIGQAFQMWGQAHADSFPMRVSIANGGYRDYIGMRQVTQTNARGVFGIFECLSNELSTPRVLICPAEDELRVPASTFAGVISDGPIGVAYFTNDLNVSYFVGVDAAQVTPRAFLAGDHNLGSDGTRIPRLGFCGAPSTYSPDFKVSLGTNFAPSGGVGWLSTLHSAQGNVALADGSVHEYNRLQLQQALRDADQTSNLGGGPNFPNPTGCSGQSVNRLQFP